MSALYMVGTPIGNLADITLRAIETLKAAARIYCEDTRHTAILCQRYGITTPLCSCHAHNEKRVIPAMLRLLAEGKECAYVSDAGTPAVSDPGMRLARAARDAGFRVTPIPGASAVHALISASGEAAHPYLFYGFLPRAAGRRERTVRGLLGQEYAFVLFESPHRIVKLCHLLDQCAPRRAILIGREMTKIYEEMRLATAAEHYNYFSKKKPRGEFTLLVTNREIVVNCNRGIADKVDVRSSIV